MEPTPSFSLNGKQIWHIELGSQKPFRNVLSMTVDATVVLCEVFNQAEEILNIELGEEKAYITAVSVPFPIGTRRLEIEMLAAVEGLSLWDDRTGVPLAILETRQILWSAYDLGVEGMVDKSREGAGAGVVVNIEVNWVCSGIQVLGVEEGVVWVIGEDIWLDSGWREDDGGEDEFTTDFEERFERFFAQYFVSTPSMRKGDKYAPERLRMITFTGDAPAYAFDIVKTALRNVLTDYPWVVFKEDFKPDEISAIGAAMLGKVLAEEEARYETDYVVDMTKFQDL
ncbi:MAG: WD40 repeat-like protein [Aureobasidium pullulans]|nr:MAG: WD40 repeat-like protein [Aureobasidium pullulans]